MIHLAKTAGYCAGVERAVNMALAEAKKQKVCTLGFLIHNKNAVKKLEENGCIAIENLEEIPQDRSVIIRSHGVGKSVYDYFEAHQINYIDATCPIVKRVHKIVTEATSQNQQIIIIGIKDHPEVIGISGWCNDPLIFSSDDQIKDYFEKNPDRKITSFTVVAQTTFHKSEWDKCIDILKKECTNLEIFDTMCNATDLRRKEAVQLASSVDSMIVVGDKLSANSNNLAKACETQCSNVFFIEDSNDLDSILPRLKSFPEIGLTAGASTPSWVIKEVYNKMTEEIKEMVEETKVDSIAEEPVVEKELSFEEMLENSIKTISNGEKVTGTITGITPTEIQIDLGTKHAGYIPLSELSDDPSFNASEAYKIGDQIEAIVSRVNDVEGTAMLSKKRLDAAKGWDDIANAVENKTILDGVITDVNKGGLVATVKGIRVFIPASQSGKARGADLNEMLKEKVSLRITELNRARRRVVGSIRMANQDIRRSASDKIWNEIEEGKEYDGIVKSLTSYGAFVDIGGVDGMVHVSELSWGRIKNPAEVVSVGDPLKVYVISFDKEKKKISLGYKREEDNPWTKFINNYKVGDVVSAKIVKLMAFGAFAEIIPNIDGLIHISQISKERIGKPGDVLSEGQEVQVKIINIDEENKRISLSIKAVETDEPKEEVNEEIPQESENTETEE